MVAAPAPSTASSRSWMVSPAPQDAPRNHIADRAILAGVKSHTVSLDTQTAEVVAADSLDYDTVLNTIKKTGKKVNTGEADGQTRDV